MLFGLFRGCEVQLVLVAFWHMMRIAPLILQHRTLNIRCSQPVISKRNLGTFKMRVCEVCYFWGEVVS